MKNGKTLSIKADTLVGIPHEELLVKTADFVWRDFPSLIR